MPKAKKLNMNDPVFRDTHILGIWLWNYEPNYKPLVQYLGLMINMPDDQLIPFIKKHFIIKDHIDFNNVDFNQVKRDFEDHMSEL